MTRYVHTGTVRDRQHPGRPCATTTRNVIVTGLPGCNELDVISSGSVPNGTGFCSVTNPDLHLVMLMTERVFFRHTNERYADCCVLERGRFDGGSLMIWGGIMRCQKTDVVVMQGNLNTRRYIDKVLHLQFIPFLHNQGLGVTFQHENARPHTALIIRQYLAQMKYKIRNEIL